MKVTKGITIQINNNTCRLVCHPGIIHNIRESKEFKFRVKGAFWSPAFQERRWDGFKRYITEGGYFQTGYLPKMVGFLKRNNYQVSFEDNRDPFEIDNIPNKVGNASLRDYQGDGVRAVLNNQVDDIPFPRGIVGAATNAGKTIIAAGIHLAYRQKTIFLINEKPLFEQLVKELEEFLPGKVGQISANKEIWADFMICMVPTLYRRIKKIGNKLAGFGVCLVDECDLATSKSYSTVLKHLYNCYVKIGLSGSPFVHKDKNKNEMLRELFGDIIFTIKSRELISRGWSSDIKVRILMGNEDVVIKGNYDEEYRFGIIENKDRNNKIYKRVKHHLKYQRSPILVVSKNHRHIEILYKLINKKLGDKAKVKMMHHKTKDRTQITNDFRDGKIDILVASLIVKRGLNFPLTKYILNTAGGDSMSLLLQLIGRGNRKHKSKKKTVMEDFFDNGNYLKRHSKHRIQLYKSEGYVVLEAYKDTIK